MAFVKICGITNVDDALRAVELGADAVGMVFAPSPRRVKREKAKSINDELPASVKKVGVFVNETLEEVKKIVDLCRFDIIQLHGDENIKDFRCIRKDIIKTIHIGKNNIEEEISKINKDIDYLLFDTYIKGLAGGSGKSFQWEKVIKFKELDIPIILSGGLTPQNVREAINAVKPFGVDVSSGVEDYPGKKDFQKLEEFLRNAKEGFGEFDG